MIFIQQPQHYESSPKKKRLEKAANKLQNEVLKAATKKRKICLKRISCINK